MSSELGTWYYGVPILTRAWFTGSVVFTLLGRFQLIDPLNMILLYERIARLEIWRLVTCALYYPTSFHYLINLYFMYNYSRRLEEDSYSARPADYAFLLLFNWVGCLVIGLVADMPLLMDPMVMSVLYVWCQLNKDVTVTFWFGTRFKAVFLPWVLLAFNLVIAHGGIAELFGILVGHVYFFLAYKYPLELGGPMLLQTPGFLKRFFPDQVGGVHGFGTAPERPAGGPGAPPRGGRYHWGRGNVLGGG